MGISPDKHRFNGRLLMLGFGGMGQGVLPLLLRHIDLRPDQILVITPDASNQAAAKAQGLVLLETALTPDNYRAVLEPELHPGDFLLNLSVNVSSLVLIRLCHARGVLYLDTCIEPWGGGYVDTRLSVAQRSNYALRESILALRQELGPGPTATVTHGANPGLVSHLLKQALVNLAKDSELGAATPESREGWAHLAQQLNVRCIHIAERDTQITATPKVLGEFVNTWSVPGLISEACQPAELGWGSHETHLPEDARRHGFGCQAAIYLERPGGATRVHSWTPLCGPQQAFLISHGESISIADYLTLGDPLRPKYRPTVLYAYHPCDLAVLSMHELAGRHWQPQEVQRLLVDELFSGTDALGVLLLGPVRGAYWYGSQLSLEQARALCIHNNATSLQVAASVMAAVIWTLQNPDCGILEPDEIPFAPILQLCRPYLGELGGTYSDWTPLKGRVPLFNEALEPGAPWQFNNFRAF
ncbi:homospermidine synthase [Metapseudomonas boanensis]|uniref:Homospermidine synthase n=1 Tax=Metapseudomonas boanensis TaxID=2822138 RepID=A0ABS5XS16_9GAMM|nr:saccharopine dehydrogenase NADP-binding domain-containing protein [Pseudomonas boanensis]MBT8769067.1 homospermidine synthase [Pseudomonas boanensis]